MARRTTGFMVVLVGFVVVQFILVWVLVRQQHGSSTSSVLANKIVGVKDDDASSDLHHNSNTPCPSCPRCPSTSSPMAPSTTVVESTKLNHTFTIIVFTYNRLNGLRTLMTSLKNADYNGRTDIKLHLFLDYPKKPDTVLDGTRAYVSDFDWPHGPYEVHRRLANAGLKRTIMESWYPVHDNEVAAFFEDDIEVSPAWFTWVRRGLDAYSPLSAQHVVDGGVHSRQGGAHHHPRLLGLSLFRPIKDELSGRDVRQPTTDGSPFLLQQPCSWGAVFFARPWRKFREWYDDNRGVSASLVDPDHPDIRPSSNTWDSGSSWKKYLIKLMYNEGWAMVYPNFANNGVLSTNHLLPGVHPTPPKKLFELPLVPAEGSMGDADRRSLSNFPPLESLRAYDVMFKERGTLKDLHGRS